MLFDDLMRNSQAQAGPLRFCREEGLEDAIEMLLENACALVFNHHLQNFFLPSDQESHFLPFRGGLERIMEQVHKDLTNLLSI
jgi:hypothetical protein